MVKRKSKSESNSSQHNHYIAIVAIVAVVAVVILVMNSMKTSTPVEDMVMEDAIEEDSTLVGEAFKFMNSYKFNTKKQVKLEKLPQRLTCEQMGYECAQGYDCTPILMRGWGDSIADIISITGIGADVFRCSKGLPDDSCNSGQNQLLGSTYDQGSSPSWDYETGQEIPAIDPSQTINCRSNPICPDGFDLIRGQDGGWQCNQVIVTDCAIDGERWGGLFARGLESVGNNLQYHCSIWG